MEENMDDKLGIPTENMFEEMAYIKNTKAAPKAIELKIYKSMTKSVAQWFDEMYLFSGVPADIKFINYGDTELVYVLTYGDKRFTLLFGQPIVPEGEIKKEAELLKKYARIDRQTVVSPLKYYSVGQTYFDEKIDYCHTFKKEAYITPYFMQARCVASQEDGFGIYVPEPEYHFEKFSENESEIVCACMLAKLISLYDEKNKSGISACKLGGGDFMLDKEWDRENLTAPNTLKHMKLIAARDEVHCSLEDYIMLIIQEFGKKTYYKTEAQRDKKILLNHKARVGMTNSAIKKGIAMGLELRRIHGGGAGLDFGSKLRGDDKTGKSVSKSDGKGGKK